MYAVVGATGNTGRAVVKELKGLGESPVCIVRNADKAANRTCPKHVLNRKVWLRSFVDVPGSKFIVACYSKTKR